MEVTLLKKINYLNEALLLASYICNFDENNDSNLPINYEKLYISKSELDSNNENVISFLKFVRSEAREKLKSYDKSGITILFINAKHSDIPEPIYFLIYSMLKQTVKNYAKEEFLALIRREFIDNMNSLGFPIKDTFTFEEVDDLVIYSEAQRYMIYKLLNNIGSITNILYDFIFDLEEIIRKYEHLIMDKLDSYYEELLQTNIEDYCDKSLESLIKSNNIDHIEYSIFIQFPNKYGVSLSQQKDKLVGYIFFGLLPLILRDEPTSIKDRKDEMFNKFNLISDYTRFSIIILLADKTMYGKEIADKLELSTGTISYHLSPLIKEGLIITKIRGKKIYYSINKEEINKMAVFLKQIGEESDE